MAGLTLSRLSVLALALLTQFSLASAQCAVAHVDGQDDTPNVLSAVKSCPAGQPIVFSANTSYNIFTPLTLTQSNLAVSILGNLSLPTNVTAVQAAVNATTNGGYWFFFNGTNVTLTGSSDATSGWINSYGQQWWDASNTIARPHLIGFSVKTGFISNIKLFKPIAWCFSLSGSYNVHVTNTLIDARSTGSFPFNTDGFDVTGSNILIEDSVIYNGDDALAVGQNSAGSTNITFRRAFIGYQSHGCSIGSLGKTPSSPANVSDILVEDVFLENTLYAARFKSWVGGTGLAKNVTYRNIGIHNVTFPIYVTQSYVDQNSPGAPRVNNASVVMQDFTYDNFYGDINTYNPGDGSCISDPCWYYEPGADGTQAVVMRCNANACQNFTLSNINLHTQSGVPATVICNNPPINSTVLGFQCQNGTFY
ncbi:glycoside hydrolase family 28 protein [Jaapia argillacea MUCL 33604]|uniref:galacturonan 1,4-alpha-galacturonidase n=1 Tax=Jaapia argillacea MUCL 33604 TaxID=933084 RepID=A0A067PS03_9AGAM|nr:glycoside hydrolase family 28 protein [Jaapia argillacea MUCL 33604]